jgi:RNA polymerase sigma-70 factor (ECF subfamily)
MTMMAGASTLGNFAGALGIPAEEQALVAELKSGSEDAYAWLIAHFQQPVYSLVYRIVSDPSDAADTTQEVFLKVFRGMKQFNGSSSLKTWVYRIAVHEASNRKRWWFRHKSKESSMEPEDSEQGGLKDTLMDRSESPLDTVAHHELHDLIESELRLVAEPYRTTVILRDIEELAYEEIAEITETTLGTVKSRLTRGREALKKRLQKHLPELGPEFATTELGPRKKPMAASSRGLEVTS